MFCCLIPTVSTLEVPIVTLKVGLRGRQRLSSHAPSLCWKAYSLLFTVKQDDHKLQCRSQAYLLASGEQVVGEPVKRQTRGHVEREVSCNHASDVSSGHVYRISMTL